MGTILIVEDDEDLRELFAEALENDDYCVLRASNGQEALELLETTSPNLMLLDVMMPVMSGTELLERLDDENRLQGLPVVVVSAGADLKDAPGASRYFRKPVELDTLLGAVRELCQA